MRYLRRRYQLGLCAAVCLMFEVCPARGQSDATDLQLDPQHHPQCAPAVAPLPEGCYYGNLHLRKTSYDIAQDVCLYDELDHQGPDDPKTCLPDLLMKLGKMSETDRCKEQATTIKVMILRQQITEMVLTASLQVDGFLAEVDSETNHIRAVKDSLNDRQTRSINHSTLWNDIGTGGGAVGSALALGSQAAVTAGSWVGAVSGGVGAAFGFLSYFQGQRSPKGCFPTNDPNAKDPKCQRKLTCPNDGTPNLGCSPAMLLGLFTEVKPVTELPGVKPASQLFHSDYDPVIREYLEGKNGKPGEKDQLITGWNPVPKGKEQEEFLPPINLTASNDSPQRISMDDLTDRQNKLSDLRAVVSRANRDLGRLTEDLTRGLRQCFDGVEN